MKKTLGTLLLSGLIWCSPFPDGSLYIGYDTDNDGKEDKREIYILKGRDPNGSMVYELIKTYIDTNRDYKFTADEVVNIS